MAKRKLTLADFEGANSLNMPSSSDTRGIADPAALQALAWGEDYDVDARRDAIAAALLAQTVAQTAPTQTAAPSFEQLTTSLGDSRLSGSGDYGVAGGASPGAGAGASQAGDSSSVSIGGLFGASTPDYDAGAPGAGFGIGRDAAVTSPDAMTTTDDTGAMTTANASMVSEPDTVVGGAFGGRGGADREGFGTNVNDPALASPTFSEPDPAVSPASVFGREGDTTAPASQAAQAAGRSALAEAAAGRAPGAISMTSNPTPGKGSFGESDPDALAEGATSTQGRGGFAGLPGGFSMLGAVVAPTAPTDTVDLNEMDQQALSTFAPATAVPSFVSDLYDAGKSMVGRGWDAVTAPTMTQSTPTFVGRVTPDSYTPTPTPSGRAPVSTGTPTPTATPDVADPGGGSSFGFSGFSEGTPGGYAGGPGMTTGFGAGYSGSSDFGNTQGAQGFTTGGFSSGATSGFSTGAAQAAADAAASAAAGFAGTGDFAGGAGPGGGGADPGGGGGLGGGMGGGSDPGGSSPGGVG